MPFLRGKSVADTLTDPTGTARIWNTTNGKILWTFHIDSEVVSSAARSPDGKWLAISDDRLIRIYDTITGRSMIVIEGHTADVLALAWSPDGHRLASGSKDGTVRVWALPI
jgi:WD40 repeat protein